MPVIDGCLSVLFTSPASSTFLARELETVFDIGRMREAFNPNPMQGFAPAEIVSRRKGTWFSFKAGAPGLIAAELCGLFDTYLEKTAFILVLRRDIVAQAVCLQKTEHARQWHSTQRPQQGAIYDGARIARSIENIAKGVDRLREYIKRARRP